MAVLLDIFMFAGHMGFHKKINRRLQMLGIKSKAITNP
jgi:hypothetical protein